MTVTTYYFSVIFGNPKSEAEVWWRSGGGLVGIIGFITFQDPPSVPLLLSTLPWPSNVQKTTFQTKHNSTPIYTPPLLPIAYGGGRGRGELAGDGRAGGEFGGRVRGRVGGGFGEGLPGEGRVAGRVSERVCFEQLFLGAFFLRFLSGFF